MMSESPIMARYEGAGEFKSINSYWAGRADKDYIVGEVYKIAPVHDRSQASHNHYFALIAEAWATLPDHLAVEYPTAEHLRKKMLVRSGYADERSIVCASKAEAQRVAAFVRPMDEYAVVSVSEAVVRVYTAQSQSMRAMGKKVFEESKAKVIGAIADLLGIDSDDLGKAA